MDWDTTLFSLADSSYHVVVNFLLHATNCAGLSSAELVAFQTDYAGSAFLCPIKGCYRSYVGYASAAELNDHKTRRHGQRLRCYQGKCVYNDVGFSNEGSLRQHVQKVHERSMPRIPATLKRRRVNGEPELVWSDRSESPPVGSATSQSSQSASAAEPESMPAQSQSKRQSQGQHQLPGSSKMNIQQHLGAVSWTEPLEVAYQGLEESAKWSATNKEKYQRAMIQLQSTSKRLKNHQRLAKRLQRKGATITPEEQKSLLNIESQNPQVIKTYEDAKRSVESFRKGQAEGRMTSQATHRLGSVL